MKNRSVGEAQSGRFTFPGTFAPPLQQNGLYGGIVKRFIAYHQCTTFAGKVSPILWKTPPHKISLYILSSSNRD